MKVEEAHNLSPYPQAGETDTLKDFMARFSKENLIVSDQYKSVVLATFLGGV